MGKLLPLILGLAIFLGGHALTRLGDTKARLVAKLGPDVYRGLYSLVALLGFSLIVYGFGTYRAGGYIPVWEPPRFFNHLLILLVWPAMVLLAATYLPGNIKARAKHPMLLAIKIWAAAHLLANGDLGSILLFGSFLAWGVWARIQLKRAGDLGGIPAGFPAKTARRNDLIAIGIGSFAAGLFVVYLHKALIGVAIL